MLHPHFAQLIGSTNLSGGLCSISQIEYRVKSKLKTDDGECHSKVMSVSSLLFANKSWKCSNARTVNAFLPKLDEFQGDFFYSKDCSESKSVLSLWTLSANKLSPINRSMSTVKVKAASNYALNFTENTISSYTNSKGYYVAIRSQTNVAILFCSPDR